MIGSDFNFLFKLLLFYLMWDYIQGVLGLKENGRRKKKKKGKGKRKRESVKERKGDRN